MQHGINPQLREWLMGPDDMLSTHSSLDARCSGWASVGVVDLTPGTTPGGSPPPDLPKLNTYRPGELGLWSPHDSFPHPNGSPVGDGKFYKSH